MKSSFFSSAFKQIANAREKQARRYVNGALLAFDDQTLELLGRSRDEIKREGTTPFYF